MEPHTSSYLSKYFVKLFRLQRRRRADYIDDGVPITRLAFTLAWFMLEFSSNKVYCGTKTLSYPWRPYKLARSRSPCIRKSWRVSVLASRVVSTELISPVFYISREIQFSVQKPIVTNFTIHSLITKCLSFSCNLLDFFKQVLKSDWRCDLWIYHTGHGKLITLQGSQVIFKEML